MTPAQQKIYNIIKKFKPTTFYEIARIARNARPTVTVHTKFLIKKKIIVRNKKTQEFTIIK